MSRRSLIRCSLMGWALATAVGCAGDTLEDVDAVTGGLLRGSISVEAPPADSACGGDSSTGPIWVLIYDAQDPPPPEGTGRPVRVAGVGGRAQPPYSVDFAVAGLPAGDYLLTGFWDRDASFNPLVDALAQPNAGDWVGAYRDASGALASVRIEEGAVSSGVSLVVGTAALAELPAFALETTSLEAPALGTSTLRLRAVSFEALGMDPRCGFFAVAGRSTVGTLDGNRDGLPDLLPRVLLTAADPSGGTRVIEGVIDPLPFFDGLSNGTVTSTGALEVMLPPVSALVAEDGTVQLEASVPAGDYAVTVVDRLGRSWTVPNALPSTFGISASQGSALTLVAPAGRPTGRSEGTVLLPGGAAGAEVWVAVFSDANPPPPAGTGTPVAATRAEPIGALERSFVLDGLDDGIYRLVAVADMDRDLSPFVEELAQPSAGDLVAEAPSTIEIRSGGYATPVRIELEATDAVGRRPAFRFESAAPTLSAAALPAPVRVRASPVALVPEGPFSVTPSPFELDGFATLDVLPRAIFLRLDESAPAGRPTRHREGTVVPGWIDPLPFAARLGSEPVETDSLDVWMLPTAFVPGAEGLVSVGRPPAGKYQLLLMSPGGQTWAVPNTLDARLGREGGPLADPEQSKAVELTAAPLGAISGAISVPESLAGAGPVAIGAYSASSTVLTGPVAATVVPPGSTAFSLSGLAPGRYTVRAFLDVDGDLQPWLPPLAQPTAGDYLGGVFEGAGALATVEVVDAEVSANLLISDSAQVSAEPPAFSFSPTFAQASTPTLSLGLTALDAVTALGSVSGDFEVRWVDVDGDGRGDVLYPLVFARLLDATGAIDSAAWTMPGALDGTELAAAGFPVSDPSRLDARLVRKTLSVAFGQNVSMGGAPTASEPPTGNWEIAVLSAMGQVWRVPNDLSRAVGTSLEQSQGTPLVLR